MTEATKTLGEVAREASLAYRPGTTGPLHYPEQIFGEWWQHVADAVAAVVRAEMAAEIETLKAERIEALRLAKSRDEGRAAERIDHAKTFERLAAAEREVERLKAERDRLWRAVGDPRVTRLVEMLDQASASEGRVTKYISHEWLRDMLRRQP